MEFLQILDIAEGASEKELKKAYRIKLKQHHPEEDPEGFKRVRNAYEQALEYVRNLDSEIKTLIEVEPQETSAHILSSHIKALTPLLNGKENALDLSAIKLWIKQIQALPITDFETLSHQTINLVLSNHWLPGEVVALLYRCFDWSMLLDGDESDSNVGNFLRRWSNQVTPFSIEQLMALDVAQQRAVLGFLRPLQNALDEGSPTNIAYHFNQPHHFNLYSSKDVLIVLCRALSAGVTIEESTRDFILQRLFTEYLAELSAEELYTLGELFLNLGERDKLDSICTQLYNKGAYGEFCQFKYQINISSNIDIALSYAFLRQKLWPRQSAFWYGELSDLTLSETPVEAKRANWLISALQGRNNTVFSTYLDLKNQSGLAGELVKAFWYGDQGSYAHIAKQRQILAETLEGNDEVADLIQLTINWLDECIDGAVSSATLMSKLMNYGQSSWFSQPELEQDELESMDESGWIEVIERHPLIPDTWFNQLAQRTFISPEVLNNKEMQDYIYRLCHYRLQDKSFDITSPWKSQQFEGDIDWAHMFYRIGSVNPLSSDNHLSYLPPLPEELFDSALFAVKPFIESSGDYLPKEVDNLHFFGNEYVFRYIVVTQVESLKRNYSFDELVGLAKKGEPCAYQAISGLLTEDNVEEAIVFWNLCTSTCKNKDQFSVVIQWAHESINERLDELEINVENFKYSSPDFLRALLTSDTDWLKKPDYFYDIEPEEESKSFHFPISLLICHLYSDWSKEGYDLEQLKPLFNRRELQTDMQKLTTDIAVDALERRYQVRLDHELAIKSSKVTINKPVCIFLVLLAFFFAPFISGMLNSDLDRQVLAIGSFVGLLSEVGFAYYLIRGMLPNVNKKMVFGYMYFLLFLSIIINSRGLMIAHSLTMLFAIRNLSPLYANGGWSRKIVKKKKVDMRRILGAPKN